MATRHIERTDKTKTLKLACELFLNIMNIAEFSDHFQLSSDCGRF